MGDDTEIPLYRVRVTGTAKVSTTYEVHAHTMEQAKAVARSAANEADIDEWEVEEFMSDDLAVDCLAHPEGGVLIWESRQRK